MLFAGFRSLCQLQSLGCGGDNRCMPKSSRLDNPSTGRPTGTRGPFLPGAMVVVTLGNPRDKFWGMILSLAPEGLSMSGIELASFEDLVVMVKDGESFTPAVVFLSYAPDRTNRAGPSRRESAFAFAAFSGQDGPRSGGGRWAPP